MNGIEPDLPGNGKEDGRQHQDQDGSVYEHPGNNKENYNNSEQHIGAVPADSQQEFSYNFRNPVPYQAVAEYGAQGNQIHYGPHIRSTRFGYLFKAIPSKILMSEQPDKESVHHSEGPDFRGRKNAGSQPEEQNQGSKPTFRPLPHSPDSPGS